MKVMNNLLLASMLAVSYEAGSAIIAETAKSGELFLLVQQVSTGTTYYKDLGLTTDKFLAATPGACIEGNLTADANYKSFLSVAASDLIFGVYGTNPSDYLGNDWGFVSTSSSTDSIFNKTAVGVDQTEQAIMGQSVALNGASKYDTTKHDSGLITSAGDKYANFSSPFFGTRINLTLSGDSSVPSTVKPSFYFVSGKAGSATPLGSWNLASGVLQFASTSGKGVTSICGGVPTPTPTPTPTPAPVAPDVGVSVSPSTTKFGKKVTITVSPKDNKKKTTLAFSKDGGAFLPMKTLPAGATRTTYVPAKTKVGKGVIRACAFGSTSNCGTANLTVTK